MEGITLIILVIVLSGLIAYLGDQIGMRVGKKRLSIFGLRPRYTSIIITIITGVLIASLSIGLLLLSNSILRQALLNINSVIERLGRLSRRLNDMEKQLGDRDEQLSQMKVEIGDKSEELEKLQQELETKREEYNQAEADLKQTRNELSKAEENIIIMEDNEEKLNERVSELQSKEEELNQRIEKLNEDYENVKELAQYYGNWAEYYKQGYENYRGSDFVFQKGDVIYSEVIVGGRSEDKIIDDVYNFLENANEMVKEMPVQVSDSGSAIRLNEDAIINMAKILYNMEENKRVIVRLVARVNVPRNGWVEADFTTNIDRIVFHQEELIASREIDAEIPHEEIASELRELLNEVNRKATYNGLLANTEGQVGQIDYSQFYELQDKIENESGIVRVEVLADENIWREDTLSSSNLRFNISQKEKENDTGN
ncbi:MAG: DUF3084 domain-containing protein [Halanaerobiaceae bacterium]